MQSTDFQNFSFYHNNYGYSSPRIDIGQNVLHNHYMESQNLYYNEEHWCETCDRSFPTLEVLDRHKQQHQKCNIDGCQFIAHPKVITKHIQMQHSSGLYSKIAKLNNPEEIQKWRDERKRNYPTKDNMEKKAAEIKEKIERGEKMGLKQFGHKKNDKIANGANKRNVRTNGRNQRNHRQKPYSSTLMLTRKSVLPKKVYDVLPTADSLRLLKPFAGIQDIIMEDTPEETVEETKCDFIIDDDDMVKLPSPDKALGELFKDNEPKICGALSSLICNYESSEDETDGTKVQSIDVIKTDKNTTVNKTQTNISKIDKLIDSTILKNSVTENDKSDDDSGPEETKIDKMKECSPLEEKPKMVNLSKVKQVLVVNKHNKPNFIKPKYKIPSTLLQKLLRTEVQQERNIVLQCIRHIVNNNYFDEPS